MATYVVLANFTQQGVQNAKDIGQRRERAKEAAADLGMTWRHVWLTIGHYDMVLVVDAPDDQTLAKFLLRTGMVGNVSTQTLRAFSEEEVDAILAGL